jgi:diadenosine tetraphosphate (Ap4A) HIT family hydrolase
MAARPGATMPDTTPLIKEYRHWSLHLNPDQCLLGRLCLVAKREDAVDFLDMTPGERDELFQAGLEARRALAVLFRPDLFNYASLGNAFRHLHVHLVPRYRAPREFLGLTFVDARWGRNYDPHACNLTLDPDRLQAIRDAIGNGL